MRTEQLTKCITWRSKAVFLMWFTVLLVLLSVSVLVSSSVCLDDLKSVSGS